MLQIFILWIIVHFCLLEVTSIFQWSGCLGYVFIHIPLSKSSSHLKDSKWELGLDCSDQQGTEGEPVCAITRYCSQFTTISSKVGIISVRTRIAFIYIHSCLKSPKSHMLVALNLIFHLSQWCVDMSLRADVPRLGNIKQAKHMQTIVPRVPRQKGHTEARILKMPLRCVQCLYPQPAHRKSCWLRDKELTKQLQIKEEDKRKRGEAEVRVWKHGSSI